MGAAWDGNDANKKQEAKNNTLRRMVNYPKNPSGIGLDDIRSGNWKRDQIGVKPLHLQQTSLEATKNPATMQQRGQVGGNRAG